MKKLRFSTRILRFCSAQDPPELKPLKYSTVDASSEIRILVLLPGTASSNIRCQMITGPLEYSSEYEALSYMWGPPDRTHDIEVDGIRVAIRNNLYAALKALRKQDKELRIWVDALCINQENVVERNSQVAMMSEIYRTASRVLVWLGEAADRSDEAMEIILNYDKPINHTRFDLVADGLLALFGRPYWRRVWIIQEVLSAQDLEICCGMKRVPWPCLYKFVDRMQSFLQISTHHVSNQDMQWRRDLQAVTDTPGLFIVNARRGSPRSFNAEYTHALKDLFALCAVCESECQDVRDRVYGLISLTNQSRVYHRIVPDYLKSTTELYFDCLLASLDFGHDKSGVDSRGGKNNYNGPELNRYKRLNVNDDALSGYRKVLRLLGNPLWDDDYSAFHSLQNSCSPQIIKKMRSTFVSIIFEALSIIEETVDVEPQVGGNQGSTFVLPEAFPSVSAEDMSLVWTKFHGVSSMDLHRTQVISVPCIWNDQNSVQELTTICTSDFVSLDAPTDGRVCLFMTSSGDCGFASCEIRPGDVICEWPEVRDMFIAVRRNDQVPNSTRTPYHLLVIGRAFVFTGLPSIKRVLNPISAPATPLWPRTTSSVTATDNCCIGSGVSKLSMDLLTLVLLTR